MARVFNQYWERWFHAPVLVLVFLGSLAGAAPAGSGTVSFYKDVQPILQRHCQGCHRPGEMAPMSLLTYAEARPWAKAIKSSVLTQKMPPWFADSAYGHFSNDRRLSRDEMDILATWASSGAAEGNKKDAAPPLHFRAGWNLEPELVIEMPRPVALPAAGAINYKFVLVKTNFETDLWVKAAEMRPGNARVLHHGKVWVRPPGSHWMEKAVPGEAYEEERNREETGANRGGEGNEMLGKFNPGLGAQQFDVEGAAKFVPKGSDLVFELHYTPTGKPETDQTRLGLVLARTQPKLRYYFSMGPANYGMTIPANTANVEIVSTATVEADCKLAYVQPHMHLRGKDYELRLIYPTGETQTVFKGRFDFNWQLGYNFAQPLAMPKGTRVVGIAHFDNSRNNPNNPDPNREVRWGAQNWDEMSNCFLGLIFDAKQPAEAVLHLPGPGLFYRLNRFWDSLTQAAR